MIRHARMRGHADALPAGRRSRRDRRPVGARRHPGRRRARAAESLGRERYLERMRRFMDETRPVILGQQQRLGASADWGRLRYTMDEGSARAVRVAFKRLYQDGLAYRSEKLVNWCPGCGTSVSATWRSSPRPRPGRSGSSATTSSTRRPALPTPTSTVRSSWRRPARRRSSATRPWPSTPRTSGTRRWSGGASGSRSWTATCRSSRTTMVEREFGTGAVKVTPAHDHADFETGERHGLPASTIIDDDATIANTGPVRRPRPRRGPRADRGGPRRARRPRGGAAARDGHRALPAQRRHRRAAPQDPVVHPDVSRWRRARSKPPRRAHPDRAPAVREDLGDWLANIHDWNLSRQLWWGHRIPAWYCPDGHVTVASDPAGPRGLRVCGARRASSQQETDMFDTWLARGLWPFSTLGWPDDTLDLRTLLPDDRDGDRLRHPLLLGRPDDDARHAT